MLWTNRGKFLMLNWVFCAETLPDNFYVVLVTADDEPTVDTNTLYELTEIADGNGYTEGGYELTPGTTDFDTLTEDALRDRALVQIKDLVWTASGGTIPASGNGARYAVLTDDSEGSGGAKQVIAVWDLVTDREAIDEYAIILTNLELRLIDLDADTVTEGEDAAPYDGDGWSGYGDANDFTGPTPDPPEALWLFETGSMLLDEMNDNDWVLYEEDSTFPIVVDTDVKIEGVSSLKLYAYQAGDGSDGQPQLRIQDAALSADFPYKTDRTNDEFTICFWVKHHAVWDSGGSPPEDEYSVENIPFRKYTSGFVQFGIHIYWWDDTTIKGQLRFELYTDEGGVSDEYYSFNNFVPDKWYHVAVTYTPGEYRIRVFDNDAEDQLGVDVTGVCGTIKETAGFLQMHQGILYGTNSTTWLDEMVVFNRVLTVEEIDKVRSGTYGT